MSGKDTISRGEKSWNFPPLGGGLARFGGTRRKELSGKNTAPSRKIHLLKIGVKSGFAKLRF